MANYRRALVGIIVGGFLASTPVFAAGAANGPFTAEIQGDFAYQSTDNTYSGNGGSVTGTDTVMKLDIEYLMVITPHILAGPLLAYESDSTTFNGASVTTSSMEIGGTFDYLFDDLRHKLIPHAYGTLRYISNHDPATGDSPTGFGLGVGFGLYYFIGHNVALTPALELDKTSTKGSTYSVDGTVTSILLGLAVFI